MEADLTLAGYRESTREQYLLWARQYTRHFMRPADEMGEEEVRTYLLHLIEDREFSASTVRGVRSALRFLYTTTLNRPLEVERLPVIRRRRPLPNVLSGTEVSSLLDAVRSPKYRALIMALYAAGLRISEGCRLRPEDIDSKRMLIHVRDGKGGRDRYTVLSTRLLEHLRGYYRIFRPKEWLFPGGTAEGHVSRVSVGRVFTQALAASSITKRATPHTLRHSFSTHLLECGTDVTVIQALLGHSSLRATEVYTHVSLEHLGRVKSPFDVLGTEEAAVLG
jgi:site-specific recombinase XerD